MSCAAAHPRAGASGAWTHPCPPARAE